MHEIAATQSEAALTPALFEAMAEIYAVLAETPLARANPEDSAPDLSLLQVLDGLHQKRLTPGVQSVPARGPCHCGCLDGQRDEVLRLERGEPLRCC